MTNYEIIVKVAIGSGLYTQDEIEAMEMRGEDIPLHTFAFWKKYGYFVKKNEHGIPTQLWRYKAGKRAEDKTVEEFEVNPEDDPSRYYMTKAYLFHSSQVERVGV